MSNGWVQAVAASFIGCLLLSDLPTFVSHHSWMALVVLSIVSITWILAPRIAEYLAVRKFFY